MHIAPGAVGCFTTELAGQLTTADAKHTKPTETETKSSNLAIIDWNLMAHFSQAAATIDQGLLFQ